MKVIISLILTAITAYGLHQIEGYPISNITLRMIIGGALYVIYKSLLNKLIK